MGHAGSSGSFVDGWDATALLGQQSGMQYKWTELYQTFLPPAELQVQQYGCWGHSGSMVPPAHAQVNRLMCVIVAGRVVCLPAEVDQQQQDMEKKVLGDTKHQSPGKMLLHH